MKKLLFLICILCALKANAQNYLISFTGTGASGTVSTVKVENLTKGTSLTLNGSDILHLTSIITGVDPVKDNQSPEIKIYPNPVTDNTTIEIFPPVAGNALIRVLDLTGKPVAQIQSYLDDFRQDFRLSGIRNGFYIINVKGNNYQITGKLLGNGKSNGRISIEKINTIIQAIDEKEEKKGSKGIEAAVEMAYSTGDRLKFTGSSGNYSTVKTDIPASDKVINFNFISCSDGDNNNYPVVVIGTQTWMAENLKTTKNNDGTPISLVTDSHTWEGSGTPAYCWYKNDEARYKNAYGAFYNWYAINTEKLCPAGWYQPTGTDWKVLTDYLTINGYGFGGSGSDIAKSLAASTGWSASSPELAGSVGNDLADNNSTGFTAIPSGERNSGGFHGLGSLASWWSLRETWVSSSSDDVLSGPYMSNNDTIMPTRYGSFRLGQTVRCLLGKSLTTAAVTNITQTTAISGGNIKNDAGAPITGRGVCWSTSPNPTITNNKTTDGAGTGIFTSSISGLSPDTKYYIRAYSTNSFGTYYGDELIFKTFFGTVTDIDENVYPTVKIGTQIWTAENLATTRYNDGEMIHLVTDSILWKTLTTPAYRWYKNDEATYKAAYGSFYNGYAVKTEKLCPAGWHVPTNAELTILTEYLKNNGYGYGGSGGYISKSLASTSGWRTYHENGPWVVGNYQTINNSSGFTGIPIGSPGEIASWSSTTGSLVLYHNESSPIIALGSGGGNVRCLQGELQVLPELITTPVSSITPTTAASGGNITYNENTTVTTRGVCWSTSPNPTIANSKTADGTGTGTFTSSITGLTAGTTYYIRAYATNIYAGTAYGNEISFRTTVTDVEGNVYNTVNIGTQVWMTENLKTTRYSNGDIIGTTTPATLDIVSESAPKYQWAWDGNETNVAAYGRLYTWYAVNDTRNLCPAGWHIPTKAEWTTLTDYLGGLSVSGGKLKEDGFTHWQSPNTGATNETGFTALPGGYRFSSGGFGGLSSDGIWWSSMENNTNEAWSLGMGNSYTGAYEGNNSKRSGYSARCIQGELQVLPTVITLAPLNVTQTTAVTSGNVTSDGCSPVTSRGICWGLSPNPAISDNMTINGTGTGSFTSSITGLTANTIYYVRSYAINSLGISYGNEMILKTFSGTITDIDGNVYNTVIIGPQTWIAENLRTTKYNDGTAIPLVTANTEWATLTTSGYSWYNNEPTNYKTEYGALYNWYTINSGKLCPSGWHVPGDAEWTTLTDYSGGTMAAGGKLKEAGLTHWLNPNFGATNENGFTAFPGGSRSSNGQYGSLGNSGYWWSATVAFSTYANIRSMNFDNSNMGNYSYYMSYGLSVRCIKEELHLPDLATTNANNITQTTAISGGNITSDGYAPITARGVCWNTSPNPTIANNKTTDGTGTGTFVSSITGLTANTTYYVRSYATNSLGTNYGNEMILKTFSGTITDIDGNVYNTVIIGPQTWIAENLRTTKFNDGTSIPLVTDNTGWASLASSGYCWYNNDAVRYKNTYGALYNWYAVNSGHLCPSGWHVPTDTEWTSMTTYLGDESVAGGKLKEAGTIHWRSPNTGATNESGFTALPGGVRFADGTFDFHSSTGLRGYWWNTDEWDINQAWGRNILTNYSSVFSYLSDKKSGYSVRCLKDN
jgi:uncharacterized protein (TIGR02145 family)